MNETNSPMPWSFDVITTQDAGNILIRDAQGGMLFERQYSTPRPPEEDLANARLIVHAVNAHAELLEIAKLFERTIIYEIKKSKTDGDDEDARLETATLNVVRHAISKVETAHARAEVYAFAEAERTP